MNEPTELLTIPQAARRLELATTSTTRLLESGLAGPTYRVAGRTHGEALLIPTPQINELHHTPHLTNHPETLIVRCGPRTPDDSADPRAFYGYDPDATWAELADALGRWWPIKNPAHWVGKPLAATIAGFFAFTGRITKYEQKDRVAFTLEHDTILDDTYLGHRIPTTRGGLIQILPATTHQQS